MKILFDLSAAQPDNGILNHGGSEYAKAVFIKLSEYYRGNVYVFYNQSIDLESTIIEIIRSKSIVVLKEDGIDYIAGFILENKINTFYTALPASRYLPLLKLQSESFRVVITIHGLRQLELPTDLSEWGYCQTFKSRAKFLYKQIFPSRYKDKMLKYFREFLEASEVITVSDYSREALLRYFPELKPEKISVFYSPIIKYSSHGESLESLPGEFNLDSRRYFLLLSASIWTKNSYRAIKAFDMLLTTYPDFKEYKMVVTGVKRRLFKVKHVRNFLFEDYLSREILETLFQNALALVYPTLNEGFGYPPLEALKYGTPVLASSIGPVKEVCGDDATYFNARDIKGICDEMLSTLLQESLFSDYNKKSRYERYLLIQKRQIDDLRKMVSLITGE